MKPDPIINIFAENIHFSKKKNHSLYNHKEFSFKSRAKFFILIPSIAIVILFFQLFRLTIVRGDYYKSLSLNNRLKEIVYPAPRGTIVDRGENVIVRNKPGYLAKVACGEEDCFRKISHDQALEIESQGKQIPIETEISREYVHPFAFSHVLGITGNVSEKELGKVHCGEPLGYQDVLGRDGVEEVFDCRLQGKYGKELVEINASGNPIKTLSKVEALSGERLVLSLDNKIQIKAYDLIKDKKGAVVAHIPQTGEILALVSSPSYDISKFSDNLSQTEFEELLNDKDKPLFNRAIAGVYPPGSTYKPIIAAGALEEGSITKDTLFEDKGFIVAGSSKFHNWYFTQYGKTEGEVDIVKALFRSNDIFFYKTGEYLGPEKLSFWSKKFNFGKKLGIELPGEAEGLVPDPTWKEKTLGEKWYLGDTYNVSIGQGNTLATPLQIAFANGVFANNGTLCRPTILKTDNCKKIRENLVSSETLNLVREGMTKSCLEGGTAFPFFNFAVEERIIQVGCKTGTAEFGSEHKTHAWFTVFAPAVNPQIMVTVLLEEGGEGSAQAAPIAKDLLTDYFTTHIQK
ncbi:hypothetical protein HYT02_00880 [Candidatus Gottesmanbacteria bacterium]|nr:hypothetical protein [Candidatus Gottesmanbacteria bacterium]